MRADLPGIISPLILSCAYGPRREFRSDFFLAEEAHGALAFQTSIGRRGESQKGT